MKEKSLNEFFNVAMFELLKRAEGGKKDTEMCYTSIKLYRHKILNISDSEPGLSYRILQRLPTHL